MQKIKMEVIRNYRKSRWRWLETNFIWRPHSTTPKVWEKTHGNSCFLYFFGFCEFCCNSGGATLGPNGALAPTKYLKILVYIYIYSRVILIKKCYIHNIFTINLKWQVIIDCYVCAKKLFKLWIKIRTNNNLPLRIYREIVVKIL